MRRPTDRIYVWFLQDVSGEWLLRSGTSQRDERRERANEIARGYEVTEIRVFVPEAKP